MTRLALSGVAAVLLATVAAPARGETIAIVGATVWERPGKKLDHATVVIRDGRIAQVAADAVAPAGARVIDGNGKVVTAGFIEARSRVGLVEIDLEPAAIDGSFGSDGDAIHAAFRASDSYDGRSVAIPIARSGGITSVIASPVGGLIAGQSAWFTLDDRPGPPRQAPSAQNAALGARATKASSRGMAALRLREVLADARAYAQNRAGYERNQSRALAGSRLDLEAMQPVLRREIPLVVRADAESEIAAALAIAAEYRIRVAIAGGAEAWRLAAALAAAQVPVIVDPTENLPDDLSAVDVRNDNAGVLAAAGVPVAISHLYGAGGATQSRTLRQKAGIAVAYGLPWAQALAAVTTVPAAIYGAKDRGTLAKGAAGDVVVWSGDPFELSSRAEVVVIGGVVQSTATHQTRLLERYRKTK